MDIPQIAAASSAMATAQAKEAVQLNLLKKAMTLNETNAKALLEGLPAQLPLATQGSVGTQVNQLV
jgi:Putative motility protein